MAITIPVGCWQQPTESAGIDSSGDSHYNFILKGPYANLEPLLLSVPRGTEVVSGWYANSLELQRGNGNTGTLTIACVPADTSEDPESHEPVTQPLKDVWTIRSVRNDVSWTAYCGPSASQPQRGHLEAWLKEPDGELAGGNSYRKPNGEIYVIQLAATLALLNKLRKGLESVIRFYPVVTRTRTYSSCPPACLENVGFCDTPNASSTQQNARKPNGLTAAISRYDWLKTQDDAIEGTDGKWQRVEAWMGIDITTGNPTPWDRDLYGANRWTMPAQPGSAS